MAVANISFNGRMILQYLLPLGTIAIALIVPYLTFRFTSRHEHHKWLREQRVDAYNRFCEMVNTVAFSPSDATSDSNEFLREFAASGIRVDLVASLPVVEKTNEIYEWLSNSEMDWPLAEEHLAKYHDYYEILMEAMRDELGVKS